VDDRSGIAPPSLSSICHEIVGLFFSVFFYVARESREEEEGGKFLPRLV
jgi:hypothetical protein